MAMNDDAVTRAQPLPLVTSYADEHRRAEVAIRNEARPHRPLRILEAGCGQRWFADLGGIDYHLTGVDRDAAAMAIRQSRHGDLHEARLGDLLTIDLPSGAFDVVYSSFVLEHVDDPERLLDNMTRWLRPGGLLIVKCPDRQSVKGFVTRVTPHWFHVAYYRFWRRNPNAGKPGHMPYPTPFGRVVSRTGLHAFARRRGLVIEQEFGRSTLVDDAGMVFQTILKLGRVLSFGRLHARYSDLTMFLRKPGAANPAA